MTTATIGTPYTLAFYHPISGLTVEVSVIRIETGTASAVTMTESTPLSNSQTRVYLGTFTPSAPGWHVVHYTAREGDSIVKSDVTRFEATVGTGVTANPSVSAGPLPDGSQLDVPAVIGDLSGTLTFSVRS
jgi:hypothetical protein